VLLARRSLSLQISFDKFLQLQIVFTAGGSLFDVVLPGKCISASISSDSFANIVPLPSALFNRLELVSSFARIFAVLPVSLILSKDSQYSIHEFFFAFNNACLYFLSMS